MLKLIIILLMAIGMVYMAVNIHQINNDQIIINQNCTYNFTEIVKDQDLIFKELNSIVLDQDFIKASLEDLNNKILIIKQNQTDWDNNFKSLGRTLMQDHIMIMDMIESINRTP